MTHPNTERKDAEQITADYARVNLTEVLSRTQYAGERFVVTKHGQPAVAVVPIEDLERLRCLDADARATPGAST